MWGLGLGGHWGTLGLDLSGICGGLGLAGHWGTLGLELSGIGRGRAREERRRSRV